MNLDWLAKQFGYISKRSAVAAFSDKAFPEPKRPETEEQYTTRRFYKLNAWVNAAVRAITLPISQVPVKIMRGEEEVENPDVVAFLEMPNVFQTMIEFIENLELSLILDGEIFIEPVNDNDGFQAYVLRSKNFEIQNEEQGKRKWRYTSQEGKEHVFAPDEIVFSREINPDDDFRGLAPLTPLKRCLITWERADLYNERFIKMGARPSGMISTSDQLDWDIRRRYQNEIKKFVEGEDNAGRIILLSHGMTFQEMGQTPKDMDYLGLIKYCRETLLAVLQIPPVQVGVFEWANYANSLIQKKMFWEESLIPRLVKIEAIMTRVVRMLFEDKTLSFEFDTSEIQALMDDELIKAQRDEINLRAGKTTINETRERDGLEPFEGGDEPLLTFGLAPLSQVAEGAGGQFTEDFDLEDIDGMGGPTNGNGDFESRIEGITGGDG